MLLLKISFVKEHSKQHVSRVFTKIISLSINALPQITTVKSLATLQSFQTDGIGVTFRNFQRCKISIIFKGLCIISIYCHTQTKFTVSPLKYVKVNLYFQCLEEVIYHNN